MVMRIKDRRWQDLDKSNIPMVRLAQHFKAYDRSEGKSPATMYCYNRVLNYFDGYLKEQNLPDTLGTLTISLVREFVLHLQTKKKWDSHPYIPKQ